MTLICGIGVAPRRFETISVVVACLAGSTGLDAWAQGTEDSTAQRVLITGSNFPSVADDAAGPLLVITRSDIERSGRTSLSDLLRSLTADNNGSLTQAFPGFAGGASGISLRGMTVNATLVLIDGRRTTIYPLSDDGQRPFVDLSSLPLDMVDRIEVLKDGASAIYGSDAIAGVVNVILRREFNGFEGFAGAGRTLRGDGSQVRWSGTYGFGELDEDGHNTFLNLEVRTQRSIRQRNRGGHLADLDLRPLGGPDLRGGIVQPGNTPPANFAQTLVGMVAPLDANNQQVGPFQLLPGCAPADLNYSGGCSWDTLQHTLIQPGTRNVHLNGQTTKRLQGDWHASLGIQMANSWSEQMAPSTYVPQPTQTDPTVSNVILPPAHPDNPFGPDQGALLYYTFGDVGPRHTTFRTQLQRAVATLQGSFRGWEVDSAAGVARAATRIRYEGTVRTSVLASLLASGRYRIGANAGLNDASVYEELSPTTGNKATSQLHFADLRASRSLATLAGGPITLGVGIETRRQRVENPGQPHALEGDVLGNVTSQVRGSRATHSAYSEVHLPVARTLDLDVALRHEHHAGLGSSTAPKAGVRWQANPTLVLRGTASRGFRVPSIVESGDSAINVYTSFSDPARCPTTNLPSDCNSIVRLSLSGNPGLKPETSGNYTVGAVFSPTRSTALAVDVYRIKRSGEIVLAPFSSGVPIYGGPDLAHPNLPPPIVGFTLPFVNSTSTLASGVDVDLQHRAPLGELGRVTGRLLYTRLLELTTTIDGVSYKYAGTHGPTSLSGNVGTPKHRAQLSLVWQRNAYEAGAEVNHVGGMSATDPTLGEACLAQESNPRCRIASFTSVDLFASLRVGKAVEWMVRFGNVFDRAAPLDTVTYGGVNYNPTLHQAGAIGRNVFVAMRYRPGRE
jgi:iron complex outermembrane receptor protein